MTTIIPAIMPRNIEDLKQKIASVIGAVDTVQIDFCDGSFSKTITWPFRDGDTASLNAILNEDEGMPYWQEMNFEFDLMVADAVEYFDKYIHMGPTRIVFHLSKGTDLQKFAEFLEGIDPYIRENTKMGVAVETRDSVEDFKGLLPHVDFVQCMGIEHIGFQGQEFDERVLEQIRAILDIIPDMEISVDGGVSLDTAPHLVEAGATRLVAGSAIFNSLDPIGTIREMEELGN